jgi:RNA polymerase sigma factor for flagellar operon FliA
VITLCPAPTASDITALVEHHLPLVGVLVSERLRNVPTHVRRDDLVSAGMLALVLSAGAYDLQRGIPFRSFATFRIRGALIDELRAMDWAPRSVRSRAREVETIRARLAITLERPPGADDIADALGISTRELDALYADLAQGNVLSLQGFATDTLPDAPANQTDCPESLLLHREQLGYLHDAIAALPERLRFVVVAYYFGHRQMSDIAVEMSVTQSRVSQLCTEATTLIRDGMNSQLDPEALTPLAQTGRAAASRNAYYRAVADRNTVAGRLDMSTPFGEMRTRATTDHIEGSPRIRIA